jgi:hypothetical protein
MSYTTASAAQRRILEAFGASHPAAKAVLAKYAEYLASESREAYSKSRIVELERVACGLMGVYTGATGQGLSFDKLVRSVDRFVFAHGGLVVLAAQHSVAVELCLDDVDEPASKRSKAALPEAAPQVTVQVDALWVPRTGPSAKRVKPDAEARAYESLPSVSWTTPGANDVDEGVDTDLCDCLAGLTV